MFAARAAKGTEDKGRFSIERKRINLTLRLLTSWMQLSRTNEVGAITQRWTFRSWLLCVRFPANPGWQRALPNQLTLLQRTMHHCINRLIGSGGSNWHLRCNNVLLACKAIPQTFRRRRTCRREEILLSPAVNIYLGILTFVGTPRWTGLKCLASTHHVRVSTRRLHVSMRATHPIIGLISDLEKAFCFLTFADDQRMRFEENYLRRSQPHRLDDRTILHGKSYTFFDIEQILDSPWRQFQSAAIVGYRELVICRIQWRREVRTTLVPHSIYAHDPAFFESRKGLFPTTNRSFPTRCRRRAREYRRLFQGWSGIEEGVDIGLVCNFGNGC